MEVFAARNKTVYVTDIGIDENFDISPDNGTPYLTPAVRVYLPRRGQVQVQLRAYTAITDGPKARKRNVIAGVDLTVEEAVRLADALVRFAEAERDGRAV